MLSGGGTTPPPPPSMHEEIDVNGHHVCLESFAYPGSDEDGFESGKCDSKFNDIVGYVAIEGPPSA
eukprot:CAMPEP_0173469140 /NCGR_PEP_ID=MMETSP1357-20121228/77208_1 /TAXON_ID=77926 /ORGANISM="Hemiselmis rufescens, Strain PCC563" /LENGTH=65 /DNA_ID=CAMNT_0014437371 /DNA_START=360 /DNA_END=557 /DNA_ORIENTATION=+